MDSKQYDGSYVEAPVGTRAVCRACDDPIVWTGEHWAHMGEVTPRHPANPAYEVAMAAPDQPDFTPEQWDFIKARIDKVLADRVVIAPQYFAVDNSQIVSVAYLCFVEAGLRREIQRLDRQVAQLQRPWWKRWLKR